jgi:hypothetical protein
MNDELERIHKEGDVLYCKAQLKHCLVGMKKTTGQ